MRTATKNLNTLLAVAGLTILLSAQALAGNVRIIANPSVKAEAISASEIKSVFLEERNSLRDGTHVEPVLSNGGPAHAAFLKDYLGQNDDALQNYYRSLVFTGKGSMPRILHSDAEVVAYVAKTRGAIGYVSSTAPMDGVKTLVVYQAENEAARKLISRVEPVYPVVLLSNHIGGTVRLKVTIASNGTVEDVELLGGSPILGEAAMAAVQKWVYAAGRSRTQTEVSIPFDPGH
ncbi:MAG: energy transducer TonB [Terriglobales bacterium]